MDQDLKPADAGLDPARVRGEIARTASVLDRHLGLRDLPQPPAYATSGISWDWPGPVPRAVAPHWNQLVSLLGCDGSGYQTLLTMRSRLQGRAEEAERLAGDHEREVEPYRELEHVLISEDVKYGSTAVAAEALGNPRLVEGEWWHWSRGEGGEFLLVLEGDEVEKDPEDLVALKTARPGETWDDLVSRAMAASWPYRERFRRVRERAEMVRFRLEVTEQVLLEYEVLGYVEPMRLEDPVDGDSPPASLARFDAADLLFIVVAHQVIQETPDPRVSLSELLSGRSGEIGGIDRRIRDMIRRQPSVFGGMKWNGDAGGGRGKAKRVATEEPIVAFVTGTELQQMRAAAGPGEVAPTQRAYFEQRVSELYGTLEREGLRTVENVVAYLRHFGMSLR